MAKTPPPKKPALLFDVEYFDSLLDAPNVSKEERHAALTDMWHLIGLCLDVGWGVYPLSDFEKENSGQHPIVTCDVSAVGSDMLYSERTQLAETFIQSAGLKGVENDEIQ